MNRHIKHLVPLAAALALAGCATVALPEPHALPATPAAFSHQPLEGAAPVADGPWWRIFGDAQLDALEERAMAHSTTVQAAAARLTQARAITRQSDAVRAPQLGVGLSSTRQGGDFNRAQGVAGNLHQLRLDASFEPDLFGRLSQASRAARLDEQAAEALLANARFVVLQVMSGRSADNSRFAGGGRERVLPEHLAGATTTISRVFQQGTRGLNGGRCCSLRRGGHCVRQKRLWRRQAYHDQPPPGVFDSDRSSHRPGDDVEKHREEMQCAAEQYEPMPDGMMVSEAPPLVENHPDGISQPAARQQEKASRRNVLQHRLQGDHNSPAHGHINHDDQPVQTPTQEQPQHNAGQGQRGRLVRRSLRRGVGLAPTNLMITAFGAIVETPWAARGELLVMPDAATEVRIGLDGGAGLDPSGDGQGGRWRAGR